MASATITLTVLRGSIPTACYVEGATVSAALALIDDLQTLDLQIVGIEVGAGDTDEVIFEYEDSLVPGGVVLSECNFSSFQCLCDCCAEKRCFEIIGPNTVVPDGQFYVGHLPGKLWVDQIRAYSPTPSNTNFNFTLYSNGFPVTNSVHTHGSPTVVERADFASGFTSGILEEDSELFVIFDSAPPAEVAWRGFSLCLLGRWLE